MRVPLAARIRTRLDNRPGGIPTVPVQGSSPRPAASPLARPSGLRTLNIAHRGASATAPENTLAAVRGAVQRKSDLVEVDVQRTRDGALVVVHDTDFSRTTDVQRVLPRRAPWQVGDLTLEEVQRLDAGSWKAPRWAGEGVPTLAAVLEVLAGKGVGLQLELKAPWLYPGVVADLVAELRAAPDVHVVVQSFDFAAMRELKARLPEQRVGLLGAPPRENLRALGSWADQLNPHHRAVNEAYVAAVHEAGMECMVWTVDRPKAMRRALACGVDGVITNRPGRFAQVCAEVEARELLPAGV